MVSTAPHTEPKTAKICNTMVDHQIVWTSTSKKQRAKLKWISVLIK
jgi:hypothetical protein